LLGNAAPADWAPHRTRGAAASSPTAAPVVASGTDARPRVTPLRDAAAVRPAEAPGLTRPVRRDAAGETALGSLLPERPGPVDRPERPASPLRSLLADPWPLPLDPFPVAPPPTDDPPLQGVVSDPDPIPVDPAPAPTSPVPDDSGSVVPAPDPGTSPAAGAVASAPGRRLATVAGHDPAFLRRGNG
jgi:hypothetical protein